MTCTRRDFWGRMGGFLVHEAAESVRAIRTALVERIVESAPPKEKPGTPWLRPPGALPEPVFLKRCTRCTDCLQACPHDAIRRLGPEWGEKSGTPVIVPQENPCFWCVDQPCVCACGVGALISQPPGLSRMGIARVDGERCYRTSGQPCDYCVTRCPLGEGAIGFPDAGPPVVRDGCTGCGMCAYLCPPGAIRIEPEEKSP